MVEVINTREAQLYPIHITDGSSGTVLFKLAMGILLFAPNEEDVLVIEKKQYKVVMTFHDIQSGIVQIIVNPL